MKRVKYLIAAVVLSATTMLGGCFNDESLNVSHNVSQQANNFNVCRRITVWNVRTDNVLYSMEGWFSLKNEGHNELAIISEVGKNEYKKDFIYLNEWVTYTVQDISGSDVDKYHYEWNLVTQPGIKFIHED